MNSCQENGNVLNAEFRLCKPSGVQVGPVINGLEEFFAPAHYASGPLALMICSPWVDGDPVAKLIELLSTPATDDSDIYLITMLAHHASYWNKVMAPALTELRERCRCRVHVRVLPLPHQVDNRAGINAEALHAKLYVLARDPNLQTFKTEDQLAAIRQEDLLEGFFGSANFTGKGLHCTEHASNQKWEIVARATDSAGRKVMLDNFRELWRSAHRVEKDNPDFNRTWEWPYQNE